MEDERQEAGDRVQEEMAEHRKAQTIADPDRYLVGSDDPIVDISRETVREALKEIAEDLPMTQDDHNLISAVGLWGAWFELREEPGSVARLREIFGREGDQKQVYRFGPGAAVTPRDQET